MGWAEADLQIFANLIDLFLWPVPRTDSVEPFICLCVPGPMPHIRPLAFKDRPPSRQLEHALPSALSRYLTRS
jgi:hypothetical protein